LPKKNSIESTLLLLHPFDPNPEGTFAKRKATTKVMSIKKLKHNVQNDVKVTLQNLTFPKVQTQNKQTSIVHERTYQQRYRERH